MTLKDIVTFVELLKRAHSIKDILDVYNAL